MKPPLRKNRARTSNLMHEHSKHGASGGAAARAPAKMALHGRVRQARRLTTSCELNCAWRLSRAGRSAEGSQGPQFSFNEALTLICPRRNRKSDSGRRRELSKRSCRRCEWQHDSTKSTTCASEPGGTEVQHERRDHVSRACRRMGIPHCPCEPRCTGETGCDSSPPGDRPLHLAPGGAWTSTKPRKRSKATCGCSRQPRLTRGPCRCFCTASSSVQQVHGEVALEEVVRARRQRAALLAERRRRPRCAGAPCQRSSSSCCGHRARNACARACVLSRLSSAPL